jgi:hypothetical protein
MELERDLILARRAMASSKYTVTNMLKEDYEPLRKYCNEHDIIIKQALAEAIRLWLDKKQEQDNPT